MCDGRAEVEPLSQQYITQLLEDFCEFHCPMFFEFLGVDIVPRSGGGDGILGLGGNDNNDPLNALSLTLPSCNMWAIRISSFPSLSSTHSVISQHLDVMALSMAARHSLSIITWHVNTINLRTVLPDNTWSQLRFSVWRAPRIHSGHYRTVVLTFPRSAQIRSWLKKAPLTAASAAAQSLHRR